MNYLHYEFNIGPTNAVEVTLDKQANVRLLDDINYNKYRRGEQHTYYGGLARVRLRESLRHVMDTGTW